MTQAYVNQLLLELATGNALEHSYRPALKSLFEAIDPTIRAVNEPSRSAHGAPDFAFYKNKNNNLVLGYVETKDIYVDLDHVEKTEQLKRYLGYASLILTNYLEFRFFRNGVKYQTISVAKLHSPVIAPINENYLSLERELKAFLEGKPETITNAVRLSQIMGGKAARVRDNVIKYLSQDNEKNQELLRIYEVMQKLLVHDLTAEKFADMYAQTLVYGLFVARYYDESPENFSRQEARDLIPASNPFLRHFFDHITGPNFDKRLTFIVDELCEVFKVSDVQAIIQKHYNLLGESTDKDPIIHFYEDFLKEYDPKLRKSMGAYYTPVPVVSFIIRAVDDVLKTEFDLPKGLADTTKVERSIMQQGTKTRQSLHKVQILDPAVGTATFLNEAVKFIYQKFKGQEGLWESYVEKELLPRLHGFELMMAPYTIAHLKLAMTFKETGIDHFDRRLGVYLTNTLEEGIKNKEDLFSFGLAEAISEESKAASVIKHETPIMVVIGNPPYSGISSNMTTYANALIENYKVEPGGNEKLKERKHWLNDDYVKFIAFAEKLIDKNGEGIVAMITNHGYLDNPTFRGMRWHLTKTFSAIYVLDLHGNSNKKESTPEGDKDENVFNIQQGVSIIIAVKKNIKTKGLTTVYRSDVWGRIRIKYDFLLKNGLSDIQWSKIDLDTKYLYFTKTSQKNIKNEYEKGVSITDLFPINVSGIVTARDGLVINRNKTQLLNHINYFFNPANSDDDVRHKFFANKSRGKFLGGDSRGWKLHDVRSELMNQNHEENIVKILYRPFDNQWIYYHPRMVDWGRENVMRNFLIAENIGLICPKQLAGSESPGGLISKNIVAHKTFSAYNINYSFPLYIYQKNLQSSLIDDKVRLPNINPSSLDKLLSKIDKYKFTDDHKQKITSTIDVINPLDILDYVYAILYSPNYRTKYKEFLKTDFPRIPIPRDAKTFWALVKLGGKLRQFHLMEDPNLENLSTIYPITGDNLVEQVEFRGNNVFINELQYFGNIPKESWEFYIGGYQPAQKWLKDRKKKKLTYEDIIHYQKIIKALTETKKIMEEIEIMENSNN